MFFDSWRYALLFLIIPLIVFLYIRAKKKSIKILSIFNYLFRNNSEYKLIFKLKTISMIFTIIAMVFLILSLMGLKWGIIEEKVKTDNYMLTIVLDLSESMNTTDVKPSRLERAKLEIEKFVKDTDNIMVSLVGFAGASFIASPFTQDMDTFSYILNSLNYKSVTIPGTRIAEALMTAKNTFPPNTASKRSIILITDGEDHDGNFTDILKEFNGMDISVYTVGIGTLKGDFISTTKDYKREWDGSVVVSKRNDDILKLIANETHGKMYTFENMDMSSIFKDIKNQASSIATIKNIRKYKDRFQIFILFSAFSIFVLLILNIIMQTGSLKDKIMKVK